MRWRERWNHTKAVLNPTVFRLGLVSLFADISSEMLYPLTPIFLTTVLGASFSSVGWIEGIANGSASLFKILSGSLADRYGRHKRLVAIGYFLSAFARPLIGLAYSWPAVLAARSLDRFGKGIRDAPRDAWLSTAIEPSQRGAAFGWHRGMDSFGAFVGPLIALLFITGNLGQIRQAFLWAFIPGLIAVAIVLVTREPARPVETSSKINFSQALNPEFKRYLLVWGFFSAANSSDAFLLLKATNSGVNVRSMVLLYCLYNLIYSIASPLLGGLSDRIGRKPVLAAGFFTFSLVYLGYGFASSIWQFGALFVIYGLYMAATDGVGKAMAIDLLPDHLRATGIGWLGLVTGFMTIFSSVVAGYLWDHYGAIWPFLFGAFGGFVAMGLLIVLRGK